MDANASASLTSSQQPSKASMLLVMMEIAKVSSLADLNQANLISIACWTLPGLVTGSRFCGQSEFWIEDITDPADQLLALQDASPDITVRLNADVIDPTRAEDLLAIGFGI
jgi:hypothetical protein